MIHVGTNSHAGCPAHISLSGCQMKEGAGQLQCLLLLFAKRMDVNASAQDRCLAMHAGLGHVFYPPSRLMDFSSDCSIFVVFIVPGAGMGICSDAARALRVLRKTHIVCHDIHRTVGAD